MTPALLYEGAFADDAAAAERIFLQVAVSSYRFVQAGLAKAPIIFTASDRKHRDYLASIRAATEPVPPTMQRGSPGLILPREMYNHAVVDRMAASGLARRKQAAWGGVAAENSAPAAPKAPGGSGMKIKGVSLISRLWEWVFVRSANGGPGGGYGVARKKKPWEDYDI